MPFDDSTRTRLQSFVGAARDLLAEEFAWQLQQTYGMDPTAGEVADLDRLSHLDDRTLATARILREIYAHYLGASANPSVQTRRHALERIAREQAFTVLNRLAALRLMEARGILLESVAKGPQSRAFQLYQRVAGTALGDTGETYQVFLFSLFDMFADDLPALFDRFAPTARLFPRNAALLRLLDLLNAPELEPLWSEDETIGWIYQYFNSAEERRRMRKASGAPRDSRELAVRNQFFTPRYVVEFLVDNALARPWIDSSGGRSDLQHTCRFLVQRPDQVVLNPVSNLDIYQTLCAVLLSGQFNELPAFDAAGAEIADMEAFCQCVNGYDRDSSSREGRSLGSHYFNGYQRPLRAGRYENLSTQEIWDGLFFECRANRHGGHGEIFKERWFLAAIQEILARLKGERDRKPTLVLQPSMLRDPRTLRLLDPACGSMHFGLYAFDVFQQIYREAWAWEEEEDGPAFDRPPGLKPLHQTYATEDAFLRDLPRLILEHNIHGVDIDPRAAQIASLALWLRAQRAWHDGGVKRGDRPAVGRGHVVAAVAPPAEEDLRRDLTAAMDPLDAELFERTLVLLKGLPELGVLLRIERELPRLVQAVYGKHDDLFRYEDQRQWQRAEDRLRAHLEAFARSTAGGYRAHLFAEDALEGLRLIDLLAEPFDVVVMNPPFGALSLGVKTELGRAYPKSKSDLLAIFVERGIDLLRPGGRLGAITSRTCFFLSSFKAWREEIVLAAAPPAAVADLGYGVMDDAMVEAAAYVLEKRP
jgi:hypothetical protein